MKRPTVASLKKVTVENLTSLGVERLAEILVAVANTRPELKRRLRMELAAEQGAEHLAVEIDKRLAALTVSRSKVSWRQKPGFVRDLQALRALITGRLAELDGPGALARMWRLLGAARQVSARVRDKDGALAAVFAAAAADAGALMARTDPPSAAASFVDALIDNSAAWRDWLPATLERAPDGVAALALREMSGRSGAAAGWLPILRLLADAAGDVDAFISTLPAEQLKTPPVAAEAAARLLKAGRVADAGALLEAAAQRPPGPLKRLTGAQAAPDFDWETQWIDYLERAGRGEEAQALRWSSFERTLSATRARDFTRRLADFDDVEAEARAFEHAAASEDFEAGLRFLMQWPAPGEAARMIQSRADDIRLDADQASLWAGQLRVRQPAAAELLLRKAAAAAFRRRDFASCDRLTAEADALAPAVD